MTGLHRLASPLGTLQVGFDTDGALVYLGFANHEFRPSLLAKVARMGLSGASHEALRRRLAQQLEAYAGGERHPFDLPIRLRGTAFEQRVWAALQRIPFGQTRSYGQLAAELGDPHLSRAVGRANGANPVSILVPCHRVIGADGSLTGYAGGLLMKARLLRLEGAFRG